MLVRQFSLLTALVATSCSAFMSQTPRVASTTNLYSSLLTKDDEAYEASLVKDIEREVRLDEDILCGRTKLKITWGRGWDVTYRIRYAYHR